MIKKTTTLLPALLAALCFSSCVAHKDLVSFQGENYQVPVSNPERILNQLELKIQPDDVLQITVNTADDETARPYNFNSNVGGGGGGGGGGNQQNRGGGGNMGASWLALSGYLVDTLGYIDFPGLGRLRVGGLSLNETRDLVSKGLEQFLKTPAVNVRFLNFRFTVLGEVNIPGTITVFNNRITLLEAIGQAGDLTPYANRGKVMVIREENGQRITGRIDLSQGNVFESPFFYLQQNDVIYIEPIQAKIATVADPFSRVLSYGSAILSLAAVILALSR